MNKIFSTFPRSSRNGRIALQPPATRFGASGFLILGVLAIWTQGSSLSQAQITSTNSAPLTVIDNSATNLPPDNTANPSAPPMVPGLPANVPPATPQDLSSSGTNSTSASPNSEATAPDNSPPSLNKAAKLYTEGKTDEALATANTVLDTDPKNINGYIIRGAIYARKQAWDLAEKDYEAALLLDPKNDGVRYDMADLKFKQKQFDVARVAFVPLQDNPDSNISDLIKYKIFLCDLFGGHEDIASKELDSFNQVGSNASYYFANAAWDLVHKKPEDARGWLTSAIHIYPERKQSIYGSILKDMGYLPLPPPPAAK